MTAIRILLQIRTISMSTIEMNQSRPDFKLMSRLEPMQTVSPPEELEQSTEVEVETEESLSGREDEISESNEKYYVYYSEENDSYDIQKQLTINFFTKKQLDKNTVICSKAISLCHEINKEKATYLYQKDQPKSGDLFRAQWMLIFPKILELIREFLVNLKQSKSPMNLRCEQFDAVMVAYNQVLRPYLDCIYDLIKHPDDQLNEVNTNGIPTGQKTSVAVVSNRFVQMLFEQLHSPIYVQRINDRRKVARRREKKILKYINKLRKLYSRLLGIRVDLYLPADKKHLPHKEIVAHFHTILQKLRRSKSMHLKGYVSKLEYGVDQALHIHCFFFFCGRKHREDISLGQMIGEMWDKQIDGNHSYFNCNASKNRKKYKYDALGVINRDDQTKYNNIVKVIRYFAKFEQYVLHNSLERVKTLNMGISPPLRRQMGRPNLTQHY